MSFMIMEELIMFKNLVGNVVNDALGLSDIGSVISPKDYEKTESDDYIFTEDNEQIFFLIKSKTDEYCFTNRAFLHLDGESAVSKKRVLKRYDYYKHKFTNVTLETAGTVDLDIEIKFQLGNVPFSIDINKKFITEIKDLYKSLSAISSIQEDNERQLNNAREAVILARDVNYGRASSEETVSAEFQKIAAFTNDFLNQAHEKHVKKDFSDIFQKYIQN